MSVPSWILATALVPVARPDEDFRVIRRVIELWQEGYRSKRRKTAQCLDGNE